MLIRIVEIINSTDNDNDNSFPNFIEVKIKRMTGHIKPIEKVVIKKTYIFRELGKSLK